MTDKQIICKCNDKECGQCSFEQQLKVKEQECEELKNSEKCAWKSLEGTLCPEAQEQLDQLKADRKEALKQLEFVRTLNTVKEAEIRKLSQTLTEIKEIADICCKTTDCKKCKFFAICENDCVDVILQKISECEE